MSKRDNSQACVAINRVVRLGRSKKGLQCFHCFITFSYIYVKLNSILHHLFRISTYFCPEMDVWAPKFRETVAELEKEAKTYITQETIKLESVADESAWQPSKDILEWTPNAATIDIILIDNNVGLNQINKHLRSAHDVGLVVMGTVVSRECAPFLILLITDKRVYAIDPKDDERGMKFLRYKLQDDSIYFWTTNGVYEADCLYHNYKIDLRRPNIRCCTGIHIHIVRDIKLRVDSALSFYPNLVRERRHRVRIEKFEDLIEMWLDIYKDDILFDTNQLHHLKTRPDLTPTAKNLIRKRCALVLPLVKVLRRFTMLDLHEMSNNVYKMLAGSPMNLTAFNTQPDKSQSISNKENHNIDIPNEHHLQQVRLRLLKQIKGEYLHSIYYQHFDNSNLSK